MRHFSIQVGSENACCGEGSRIRPGRRLCHFKYLGGHGEGEVDGDGDRDDDVVDRVTHKIERVPDTAWSRLTSSQLRK